MATENAANTTQPAQAACGLPETQGQGLYL